MKRITEIILCFCLFAACNIHAQTYAKYTTKKAKATETVAPEKKPAESVKENKPTAPEIKTAKAIKPAEKPVEKKPTEEVAAPDFEKLMRKAAQQYKDKKFHESVDTYTQALAISPAHSEYFVLNLRGYSYLGLGEHDKAIEDCTAAINKAKIPNDTALGGLLFLRSMAFKARSGSGDDIKACSDYKKARETGYVQGDHVMGYENCR